MKYLLLICTVLLCPMIGYAATDERINNEERRQENETMAPWEARLSFGKRVAGFTAGVFAGFGFHEACHQIAAEATDTHMDWIWKGGEPYWLAQTASDNKLRIIASAGLTCQVISSEVMLGVDQIPKDNAFVVGWLSFNIYNAIFYAAANEIQDGYDDLGTLKATGVKTEYVEAALIAHALLSAYRLWRNPDFPVFIDMSRKEIVAGFRWEW